MHGVNVMFSCCCFFSAFLHRRGSVCDRFEFLCHVGSHILSSGVHVPAGYFRVSIIHWTLKWTTGSLMCVHDLSYACVYTQGLGTPTASQHNVFDSGKLKVFFVLRMGFEPLTFGSPVQRSNHWDNPSPQMLCSIPFINYLISHILKWMIISTSVLDCPWQDTPDSYKTMLWILTLKFETFVTLCKHLIKFLAILLYNIYTYT